MVWIWSLMVALIMLAVGLTLKIGELTHSNKLANDDLSKLRQSPDVLVESLANRVEIAKKEISRLREDGEEHKGQIYEKEAVLQLLRGKLNNLNSLLEESELLCPECKAPLLRRDSHTIYGSCNGRDAEAEIEYVVYECGYVRGEDQTEPISTCGSQESPNRHLGGIASLCPKGGNGSVLIQQIINITSTPECG